MPKSKKETVTVPSYSLGAAKFGGEVAETCIPQIRPVIDALPPEDVYSFWCGLMSAFAGMANATLPKGATMLVLESVMKTVVRNAPPPAPRLN